jgi:chromosome segregation ATPase
MTEADIQEMRSRIAELEKSDADFARKSNLLLDEILLTRDQINQNSRQIDQNSRAIAESRRDIDQLATRTGELAQSISELRQNVQLVAFTVSQVSESMTILRQTQQAFVEQAVADRQAFQAEIQRIWEYLMTTRPNGRGDLGAGG